MSPLNTLLDQQPVLYLCLYKDLFTLDVSGISVDCYIINIVVAIGIYHENHWKVKADNASDWFLPHIWPSLESQV